jgi:hypothetical protein
LRHLVRLISRRSIGCLIFELITLVPLDSPYYCLLKGRERRRGVFGSKMKTA